jgi:hypothetical protein
MERKVVTQENGRDRQQDDRFRAALTLSMKIVWI